MNSAPEQIENRWWHTGFALVALLAATWAIHGAQFPALFTLVPKATMVIPSEHELAWFEFLVALVFILLSVNPLRGRVTVSHSLTTLLTLVSGLYLLHLYGQVGGASHESYLIIWPVTLLSMAFDVVVLALVWWAWSNARRRPSPRARTCLNWLVSFYLVNVWCGGVVWFNGV